MDRRVGRRRDGVGAVVSAGSVLCLYGAPVLLALIWGSTHDGLVSMGSDVFPVMPDREAVVWIPPRLPGPPADPAADEPIEPSPEPAVEPTPDASPADDASPSDGPAPDTLAMQKEDRRQRLKAARLRRLTARGAGGVEVAASGPSEPPPEPTRKEERELERQARKRERRAERKQCAELVDQIVQVSEDEWWFGRELVNCYRTHLEQFDLIGGVDWSENDRGKKEGIKVYVSRSRRGEPGRLAGFRTGDVIRSLNGVRVAGWGGVAVASTQLLRSHVKVKRIRDGEEQIVHLRVVGPDELDEAKRAQQALVDGDRPTGPDAREPSGG